MGAAGQRSSPRRYAERPFGTSRRLPRRCGNEGTASDGAKLWRTLAEWSPEQLRPAGLKMAQRQGRRNRNRQGQRKKKRSQAPAKRKKSNGARKSTSSKARRVIDLAWWKRPEHYIPLIVGVLSLVIGVAAWGFPRGSDSPQPTTPELADWEDAKTLPDFESEILINPAGYFSLDLRDEASVVEPEPGEVAICQAGSARSARTDAYICGLDTGRPLVDGGPNLYSVLDPCFRADVTQIAAIGIDRELVACPGHPNGHDNPLVLAADVLPGGSYFARETDGTSVEAREDSWPFAIQLEDGRICAWNLNLYSGVWRDGDGPVYECPSTPLLASGRDAFIGYLTETETETGIVQVPPTGFAFDLTHDGERWTAAYASFSDATVERQPVIAAIW